MSDSDFIAEHPDAALATIDRLERENNALREALKEAQRRFGLLAAGGYKPAAVQEIGKTGRSIVSAALGETPTHAACAPS